MATSTARKVAASGFGATPAGRDAVVRGPKPAGPAAGRPATARTGARSTSSRPSPAAGRRPAAAAGTGSKPSARGPDYRAPKQGPTSKNRKVKIPGGSVRAQHLLMGELLLCLVVIVLADVMETGDLTSLPIEATALAALFLLLSLISTGGRGAERVAVALGGLVTLGLVVKRWGVFPALNNTIQLAYVKAYGRKSAVVQPDPGVTAASPGPPVSSPVPPRNQRLSGGLQATF